MTTYSDIDDALANRDVKRAEVAIVKRLRGKNAPAERADLLIRRARARLLDARADEALEDLETALALRDAAMNADLHILFGDIYFARFELAAVGFADRNDADTALQHYQHILDTWPDTSSLAWVHYQAGRILLSQNETEAAAKHLGNTLASPCQPDNIHALAHERLGFIALFEHRQPAEALAHFNAAKDRFPSDDNAAWLVQLHIQISRAHLELGEYEEALADARRALREIQSGTASYQRSTLPEAHMAIGDVLALMPGQEADAIEHYLRFLQTSKRPPSIDVTWSQVHERIGQLSFKSEHYQQAINAFQKALEFNPYHPLEMNLRYQVARCHYRMRAFEQAANTVEKMLTDADTEGVPITDWRVPNLLGNAYFALERYEQAVTAYQQAMALAPTGTDSLERTKIYLRFSEELSQSSA